ncbi:MAG: YDG domain-containing protein, partial [Oscillospiraceae bacterium]|nr:YDG domain-containing protein [Oscillospiraceae bacterium]
IIVKFIDPYATGGGGLFEPSQNFTVLPREVTVAWQSDTTGKIDDKVYDAKTGVNFTNPALKGSDLVTSGTGPDPDIFPDDDAKLVPDIRFTDKNVGTNKNIKIVGVTLDGTAAGNYIVKDGAFPTDTRQSGAEIKPLKLALANNAVRALTRDYDGTTDATIDTSSIVYTNIQSDDSGVNDAVNIAVDSSFEFIDPNAGVDKVVHNGTWKLEGADMGNYLLPDSITITGTINKKTLTIDPGQLPSKLDLTREYNGSADVDPSKLVNIEGGLIGLENGESLKAVAESAKYYDSTGTTPDPNAGDNKVVRIRFKLPDGAVADNYELSGDPLENSATCTGEITKAKITLVTPPVIEIVANMDDRGPTFHLSHLKNIPDHWEAGGPISYPLDYNGNRDRFKSIDVENEQLVYTTSGADNTIVGDEWSIKVSLVAANYESIAPVDIKFKVVNKTKIIVGQDDVKIANKLYDGYPTTVTGTPKLYYYETGQPFEQNVDLYFTYSNRTTGEVLYDGKDTGGNTGLNYYKEIINTGMYLLTIYCDPASTFTLVHEIEFEIGRAGLTIKPKDMTIANGDPIPVWGADDFEIDGLLPGDTPDVLTPKPQDLKVKAGLDNIQLGTQIVSLEDDPITAANYVVTKLTGTLTVKPISIDENDYDKWLTIKPPVPDGNNNWYKQDITAQANTNTDPGNPPLAANPAFMFVGYSLSDNDIPTQYLSGENVFADADIENRDVWFYLSDQASGGLIAGPIRFSYKMDQTDPVIDTTQTGFVQEFNQPSGTLSTVATDAMSGVNRVFARLGAGPLLPMTVSDGVYSCVVDKSGKYDIVAEDNAGNVATAAEALTVTIESFAGMEMIIRKGDEIVGNALELNIVDGAVRLTAEVVGANMSSALYTFVWSVQDTQYATAVADDPNDHGNPGVVTPLAVGTTKLKVYALGLEREVTLTIIYGNKVPPGVLPPGVDPEDVRLLITALSGDKKSLMRDDLANSENTLIKGFLEGRSVWDKFAEWW